MLILGRTVRFTINPPPEADHSGFPGANGYGGVPAMRGIGRYFEVNVLCRGQPDSKTGYLVNIKEIDRAVRNALVPRIAHACAHTPERDPASLLPELLVAADAALRPSGADCVALRWMLTPYYSVEMALQSAASSTASAPTVLLRQKFDFAASHRLHVASLSDQENRDLFGKCNNPGGHGHNYQFEPCIAMQLGPTGRPPFSLGELERLADETLVQRFDHTHLNLDTAEFSPDKGGVNPTVENIARIFYELFAAALKDARAPVELRSMTVWETDRTSATYPA
jgi:6-pyruvoyltetrahydropterin/6-carboxytetrahydropterin synthase